MIVATYYQIELGELSTDKFMSLVFAWLYDNTTRSDHARDIDHWKKHYDQYFGVFAPAVDAIEEAQKEFGIKPAVAGKEATIKLRSKLPKMKPNEAAAYQAWVFKNPDNKGDYAAAETWLLEYRK